MVITCQNDWYVVTHYVRVAEAGDALSFDAYPIFGWQSIKGLDWFPLTVEGIVLDEERPFGIQAPDGRVSVFGDGPLEPRLPRAEYEARVTANSPEAQAEAKRRVDAKAQAEASAEFERQRSAFLVKPHK
jgi:hypothetical protein